MGEPRARDRLRREPIFDAFAIGTFVCGHRPRCRVSGGERGSDDPFGVIVKLSRIELPFGEQSLDLMREWHRLVP